MLQTQTVNADALELLKVLQSISDLQEFRLVGGTALALQLGHRYSIDLDLFSYNNPIPDEIQNILMQNGLIIENISLSKRIKILKINQIKVDLVNYPYAWLKDNPSIDGIRLASLEDIAAMKFSTITNRGTKKDFVDLFFIFELFEFKTVLNFYKSKYPESSEFLLFKSLIYFDDAENEPMPKMFLKLNWKDVKKRINDIARKEFL